jgi:hypothetical protein
MTTTGRTHGAKSTADPGYRPERLRKESFLRPAEANDAVIGVMITTYSVSCKGALRSESRLHDTWRSLVGSAGNTNATLSKPGAET